ncbi:MAG TPA: BadF/BadG/BcrA/BcrD ATPase family protein [Methylomirabilota bacterium]|nr:BadF/BadG/BcrA/BcrD ATPase family protein [Methylomirabilota bacterium]
MLRRSRKPGPQPVTWAVGIDLGGTWVRAAAVDHRGRRRSFVGPTPGLAKLPTLIRRLWHRWGFAPEEVAALVVASRGVWTRAERRVEQRRLRGAARHVRVISDVEAAYHGALGARPGVLLLAGTGSIALGRDARGRWARAGGLGPLLGDEGSAFWIGREWLRAAARQRGRRPGRRLGAAPDAIIRIAALAPAVLRRARRGDRAARLIVATAHHALAQLLRWTARDLRLRPPIALSWAGSLLDDAGFRGSVWRAARRQGVRLALVRPRQDAAGAAARLAAELARRA